MNDNNQDDVQMNPLPQEADQPAAEQLKSDAPPAIPVAQARAGAVPDDASSDQAPGAAGPGAKIRFEDVVSGQFDADEESPDLALPKRVLAPQAETPKLHKVLAQAGIGSMENRSGSGSTRRRRGSSPITSPLVRSSRTTTRRTGRRFSVVCPNCNKANGNPWVDWTSIPRVCCCSPVPENWPTT